MQTSAGRGLGVAGVIACAAMLLPGPAAAGARTGDAQAAKLLRPCFSGSSATCRFTPRERRRTKEPPVAVSAPVVNCTDQPVQREVRYARRIAPTNSVELPRLTPLAIKPIEARYGRQVTKPYTYRGTMTVTVPPKSAATVLFADPVIRVTGDWTIIRGARTEKIDGAWFDFPAYPIDALNDRNAAIGIAFTHSKHLSPAQEQACGS